VVHAAVAVVVVVAVVALVAFFLGVHFFPLALTHVVLPALVVHLHLAALSVFFAFAAGHLDFFNAFHFLFPTFVQTVTFVFLFVLHVHFPSACASP